jgi:two-component system, sensor histidine kinase LadS
VERRRTTAAGLRWCAACLVAALLWLALPVRADHPMALDPAAGTLALGSGGEAWLDAAGSRRVEDVAADPAIAWEHTADRAIYPLAPGKALWIRFLLSEPDGSERWYLEVPYPAVNRVTLYARNPQGRWMPSTAGDTLPVADWPLPHRHPLLPLLLSSGPPQTFLVRVENPHSYGAPLQFVSERQLVRQEQRTALILGIYFGLAGLATVLSLVAAFALRDPTFGWYAASVVLLSLSQAGDAGGHRRAAVVLCRRDQPAATLAAGVPAAGGDVLHLRGGGRRDPVHRSGAAGAGDVGGHRVRGHGRPRGHRLGRQPR